MIPTITNSCVLLRPYHTQSQQQQREEREEKREEEFMKRLQDQMVGGGVNEEIARPDGGLNCPRGPIPFT
jgi:hypothetical protein